MSSPDFILELWEATYGFHERVVRTQNGILWLAWEQDSIAEIEQEQYEINMSLRNIDMEWGVGWTGQGWLKVT